MHKTHQGRTTFWSCDVKKAHAVVARSTFRSQNVQNTRGSDHFWRFRCQKSARRCGAKHISKSKCLKHKGSDHFWRLRCRFAWQAQGIVHLFKSEQNSISKNDGRHGTFEKDLQRRIFRGRRSTKDMFMRDVRRSGRWFPERGCILEYQMCRFAKMILRDRCSTSYDLASIFPGRRSTLDRWTGKIANALVRGCQLCTQLSIFEGSLAEFFHFWCLQLRKMRSLAELLVSDVVKFKKWRRLAELFRFGRCYVQTLRKSRRISSFLILQIDR